MRITKHFDLTEDHLKLLRRLNIRMNETGEGPSPGADLKRPYGSTDVVGDIATILGWKKPGESIDDHTQRQAWAIHDEIPTAMQIVLVTQSFAPGSYSAEEYNDQTWKRDVPPVCPACGDSSGMIWHPDKREWVCHNTHRRTSR